MTRQIDRQIESTWSTPVWVGRTDIAFDSIRFAIASSGLAEPEQRVEFDDVPETTALELDALLLRLIRNLDKNYQGRPSIRGVVYRAGYRSPIEFGSGEYVAHACLWTTDNDADPPEIILHDPRAGVGLVGSAPGHPWGRSIRIPLTRGLCVVHPGWVSWSISPVTSPHEVLVARASS